MTTITTEDYHYKVVCDCLFNTLNLPTELAEKVLSFWSFTDQQKLYYLINRFKSYEFRGDKRKFGDYIRKNFDGKRWRRYGLTYLVKSRQPTRPVYNMRGELSYIQRLDGKFNSIHEIIDRLIGANHTDLLPFLLGLEKYMKENKFIKLK